MAKKRKKRVKRGHPVAILIGLHDKDAVFWRIFSETIRLHFKINRGRKRRNQNKKQLYHFHEEIGATRIVSLLLIPIAVFIFFLAITYIFPNVIPPRNLIVTPKIDPASGQPLSLDPIASLIVSLINGTVYGSTAALIEVLYVIRRRSK